MHVITSSYIKVSVSPCFMYVITISYIMVCVSTSIMNVISKSYIKLWSHSFMHVITSSYIWFVWVPALCIYLQVALL